jgi:hypothetical protein
MSALVRTKLANRFRLRPIAAGLAAIVLAGFGGLTDAIGQPMPSPPKQSFLVDSTLCHTCHRAGPIPEHKKAGVDRRVTMKETDVWSTKDRHSKAYEVLESQRGKAMQDRLSAAGWKALVTEDARCLSCHSTFGPVSLPQADAPASQQPDEDFLKKGVDCQACHGPASAWIFAHQTQKWWVEQTPEQKAAWGLNDVRNPEQRAEMCASCHIGSVREGKVVTHEMYAAGHPPLPSFEVETFMKMMPTHGLPIRDRFAALPAKARPKWYHPEDLYFTTSVATATVVALRETAELLADQAAAESGDQGAASRDAAWPELAVFDCGACHHELREPSWRQNASFRGRPGRPALRAWPLAMYEVVAGQASNTDSLADRLVPLHAVLDRQPFGKAADVATAGRALSLRLDEDIARVQERRFDRAEAVKLLKRICDAGAEGSYDFDAARQLSWSLLVILDELRSAPDKGKAGIDFKNPQLARGIEQLTESLHLDFRRKTAADPGSVSTLDDSRASLRAASDYDPHAMQQIFQTLRVALFEAP